MPASTPSRPIANSALPPIPATTASQPKSSNFLTSIACACFPTIPTKSANSRKPGSLSPNAFPASLKRATAPAATSKPRKTNSAIFLRAFSSKNVRKEFQKGTSALQLQRNTNQLKPSIPHPPAEQSHTNRPLPQAFHSICAAATRPNCAQSQSAPHSTSSAPATQLRSDSRALPALGHSR